MEKEELFKIFKTAVEREFESYELYKSIAEKSNDMQLKMIFEEMAKDEFKHREKIMGLYKTMKES